jgi:hypothetical protein
VRAFLIAMASALALSACASSTGRALPAGPDTYTLTERFVPIRGGGDEAQRQALTKANDFCKTMGKKFVPNNMGRADWSCEPNIRTYKLYCHFQMSLAK